MRHDATSDIPGEITETAAPADSLLMAVARRLDAMSADDLNAQLLLAEQMRELLGSEYADFDRRYCELIERQPKVLNPAQTVVGRMEELATHAA